MNQVESSTCRSVPKRLTVLASLGTLALISWLGWALRFDLAYRWHAYRAIHASDHATRRTALLKIEEVAIAPPKFIGVGSEDMADTLIASLTHEPDSDLRTLAAVALTRMGPRASRSAAQLCTSLRTDPSPDLRSQAAHALRSLFDVDSESARIFGFDELPNWRCVTVQLLDAVANDDNSQVRREAVSALGGILAEAHRVASRGASEAPLDGALQKRVAERLRVTLIDDESPQVRWAAAYALGLCGPDAAFAVPALIHALSSDPDSGVRENALLSIGALAPSDADSIQTIHHALREDRSPSVRIEALRVVILRIPDIAPDCLESVLRNETDEEVRVQVAVALGKLGSRARICFGALKEVASSDSSPKVRAAALEAIQQIMSDRN